MKVSGFTIIRNACLMGYPIVESIQSILPLVDEFVIGVGQSDDDTDTLIASIQDKKIKIIKTHWDTSKTQGGVILVEKTDEVLSYCSHNWCFYLQADEVIHENEWDRITTAMKKYENQTSVEGLLFQYIHFYGSFHIMSTARNWYRNEIRIIKKDSGAQSSEDSQGFRIQGRKLRVAPTHAHVYHYGYVKSPQLMGQKCKYLSRWWHGHRRDKLFDHFVFNPYAYGLKHFTGSHPKVMRPRIAQQDWTFEPQFSLRHWSLKDWRYFSSDAFEKISGIRLGEYRPYTLLKEV